MMLGKIIVYIFLFIGIFTDIKLNGVEPFGKYVISHKKLSNFFLTDGFDLDQIMKNFFKNKIAINEAQRLVTESCNRAAEKFGPSRTAILAFLMSSFGDSAHEPYFDSDKYGMIQIETMKCIFGDLDQMLRVSDFCEHIAKLVNTYFKMYQESGSKNPLPDFWLILWIPQKNSHVKIMLIYRS